MPDLVPISALPPLQRLAQPGRHGLASGAPGVRVREITGRAVVQALVAPGGERFFKPPSGQAAGAGLPQPGKAQHTALGLLLWSGPGQYLVMSDGAAPADLIASTRECFGPVAALIDQSDSRAMLRLGGPRIRDCLAKGVALDLHPSAFSTGDCALTNIHHVSVQLWQINDAPVYEMAFARSYSASLWHWLEVSAAEYGLNVDA